MGHTKTIAPLVIVPLRLCFAISANADKNINSIPECLNTSCEYYEINSSIPEHQNNKKDQNTNRPYYEEHLHPGLMVNSFKAYPNAETCNYDVCNHCSSLPEQLRNASANNEHTTPCGTINYNTSAILNRTNPCKTILNYASANNRTNTMSESCW